MSDATTRSLLNAGKVLLAFMNAFAGILAAYPGPEISPLLRLLAAATVAGCGAALLMVHPPGRDRAEELRARFPRAFEDKPQP